MHIHIYAPECLRVDVGVYAQFEEQGRLDIWRI